jgi:hypothetical protein
MALRRGAAPCAPACASAAPGAMRLAFALLNGSASRRGGRAVEGARLESVYAGNRIAGSNPAPSAKLFQKQLSFEAEYLKKPRRTIADDECAMVKEKIDPLPLKRAGKAAGFMARLNLAFPGRKPPRLSCLACPAPRLLTAAILASRNASSAPDETWPVPRVEKRSGAPLDRLGHVRLKSAKLQIELNGHSGQTDFPTES